MSALPGLTFRSVTALLGGSQTPENADRVFVWCPLNGSDFPLGVATLRFANDSCTAAAQLISPPGRGEADLADLASEGL